MATRVTAGDLSQDFLLNALSFKNLFVAVDVHNVDGATQTIRFQLVFRKRTSKFDFCSPWFTRFEILFEFGEFGKNFRPGFRESSKETFRSQLKPSLVS